MRYALDPGTAAGLMLWLGVIAAAALGASLGAAVIYFAM